MRKYNAVESKALFTAAKTGNVAQLEIAIQNGADPNFTNRADDGSPFPLHETAKINDHTKGVACAKILLDHGADTSTRILTTKNTPLHEGKGFFVKIMTLITIDRVKFVFSSNISSFQIF